MDVLRTMATRVLVAVPVLFGVVFVVFVTTQLAPGDPATSTLGVFASQEAREAYAEEYDLDAPVVVRFVRFARELLAGDLGDSLVRSESVAELVRARLPLTAELTLVAIALAVAGATIAGSLAATYRDSILDRVIGAISIVGIAAPVFWTGLLAIQLFSLSLGWLPAGGHVRLSSGLMPWLESILLPAATLAFPVAAGLTRLLRAAVIDELSRDYVRTARGSGLSLTFVVSRHVLKNALIAPVTVLGVQIGYLLGGAIIVEQIFAYPGMGSLLVEAVLQGDLGVLQGVALVGAASFVGANLAVDLAYVALRPRVRDV